MRRLNRVKIIRSVIEKRLDKNARRIQRIAEESYKLRKQLEESDEIEAAKNAEEKSKVEEPKIDEAKI